MVLNLPHPTRDRAYCGVVIAYIAALLALGGGGTPAPLSELACQILAAVALIAVILFRSPDAPLAPHPIWLVAALVTIVPLLQLMPLPPALWQALPGRELVRDSLALVGAADDWRPLAVAPQRTLDAVLALLPPLVALVAVSGLNHRGRQLVLRAVAAMGLASIAIGTLQLTGDGHSIWQFYGPAEQAHVLGFQANRNAEADVLLIAVLALVAGWLGWIRQSRSGLAAIVAVAALLALGTVLTGSRTGVLLVPVALGWIIWLWRHDRQSATFRPRPWQWGVLALTAAGLATLVWQTRAVGRVIARFGLSGEYRPEIWRDTLHAIGEYWPVGSGLGSFTRAIGPAERLEAIGTVLPNRAHNEYLELLLEGGAPLAACWLAVAALVLVATVRALRGNSQVPAAQAMFAAGTINIVALHSLVDYPFRTMALAGLVAIAAAMVLAPSTGARAEPDTGSIKP